MDAMDVNVSAALQPGKFFLQKLGLWFERHTQTFKITHLLRYVAIFNIFLFILINILNIIFVREKSLVESSFEVLLLLRQISVFQKMLILRIRMRKISELFSNAFGKIVVPELCIDAFGKYQKECRKKPRLIIALIVFSIITALIWIISNIALAFFSDTEFSASSLLSGAIVVPLWHPFDEQKYSLLQKFVMAYQILGIQPMIVTILGFFAFYSGALMLSQQMFKHLDDVLMMVHMPINRDPPFVYDHYIRKNQEVKDILRYAVQHHIRSLNFVEGLNNIFSSVILLEIWGILACQCIMAFQFASLNSLPILRQMSLLQNIITLTLQLLVICYFSSQVTEQARKVSATIFGTAWWSWDKSNQLSMKIIAIRSTEKVELKGGHIYSLTLTTVVVITEISFTYFMFLYQLNQQTDEH